MVGDTVCESQVAAALFLQVRPSVCPPSAHLRGKPSPVQEDLGPRGLGRRHPRGPGSSLHPGAGRSTLGQPGRSWQSRVVSPRKGRQLVKG